MINNVKGISTRKIVVVGLLGSISIVLGMTPLGFIPVGPTRATIMHIPVIIGGIMEGPLVGGLIGLIFGLFSIFQAVTNPTPVSFVFLNPVVSVLPRILIGIVAYYSYNAFNKLGIKRARWILNALWGTLILYLTYGIYVNIRTSSQVLTLLVNGLSLALTIGILIYTNKKAKNKAIDTVVSAGLGTLTNTFGVLSAIYFLYGEKFVEKMGQSGEMAKKVIMGIGIANGIPETIIAIIIVTNVIAALNRNE